MTPLGNIRRGEPLPLSEGGVLLPRPARGSTEVQREACNTFTTEETTERTNLNVISSRAKGGFPRKTQQTGRPLSYRLLFWVS